MYYIFINFDNFSIQTKMYDLHTTLKSKFYVNNHYQTFLVSAVEKWEEIPLVHGVGDGSPLLLGRVRARRVVRRRVQDHYGPRGQLGQALQHAAKGESLNNERGTQ